MKSVTISAADAATLAELARLEAEQHAPRTPERRAAAALWTAFITTRTIDGARAALPGFAAPDVQADALELLHRLAAQLASPEDVPAAQGDGAAPTGRNRP
jgi:hypothetical protein